MLTSILADSDAWVGAIVTGLGLLLVVIGIAAAHKRRTGYLYCVSIENKVGNRKQGTRNTQGPITPAILSVLKTFTSTQRW